LIPDGAIWSFHFIQSEAKPRTVKCSPMTAAARGCSASDPHALVYSQDTILAKIERGRPSNPGSGCVYLRNGSYCTPLPRVICPFWPLRHTGSNPPRDRSPCPRPA
jgi:hypothetical protein